MSSPGTFVIAQNGGTTNIVVRTTCVASKMYRIRVKEGAVSVFTDGRTPVGSAVKGGSIDVASGDFEIVLQANKARTSGTYEVLTPKASKKASKKSSKKSSSKKIK